MQTFTYLMSEACLEELVGVFVEHLLESLDRLPTDALQRERLKEAIAAVLSVLLEALYRSVPVGVVTRSGEPYILEHRSDDKFIYCAIDGEADCIISNDRGHVLAFFARLTQPIRNRCGIEIQAYHAREFVNKRLIRVTR